LGAAGQLPAVAHRFANGFDDPADFENFFYEPDKTAAYLEEAEEAEAAGAAEEAEDAGDGGTDADDTASEAAEQVG
ncbi:FAD-binding oxidoreductase, partial [Streptomyces sp. MCAF7]